MSLPWGDLAIRFLIGGLVVSLFSVLGDAVKPKSLGGIFAAAPTIALANLALTCHRHGAAYTALETRSMIGGGLAFLAYASVVSFVLMRRRPASLPTSAVLLTVWLAVAALTWTVWLRR